MLLAFYSFWQLQVQYCSNDISYFQISRVPGYEERLKAMLFKVNFAEKVDEVKTVSDGSLDN